MKKHFKKICLVVLAMAMPLITYAQTAENLLNKGTSQVQSIGKTAVTFISYLMGLVGVIMLGWNFYKRAKGDQQSNDALVGWGSALIFAFIMLQIISAAFFN